MNVSGEKALYANAPLPNLSGNTTSLTNAITRFEYYGLTGGASTGNNTSDFIWDGIFPSPDVAAIPPLYDDNIYIHIDHPEIGNIPGTTTPWTPDKARMTECSTIRVGDTQYPGYNFSELQLAYRYDLNEFRTSKMSFSDNDQYLLGGKSCGAFLFMSPTSIGSLGVDGDNKFGKRTIGKINKAQVNSLKAKSPNLTIDIIFQYRMTDYFGVTTSGEVDTSSGKIGGKHFSPLQNLTYSKTIGIDIFDNDDNQFSFDLSVFAKYKPKGFNLSNTKAVILSKSI
jgi:hypothetical protein